MRSNLTRVGRSFVMALSILFLSAFVTKTAAVSSGPECGECMRAAAQFYKRCLEAGKAVSTCQELFEAERDICRATVCGPEPK